MFPITFNAIGDIIALAQIGIYILKGLKGSLAARAEVKASLGLFTSLKDLLDYSKDYIEECSDADARRLADIQIRAAYDIITGSLKELFDFEVKQPDRLNPETLHIRLHPTAQNVWKSLHWSFRGKAKIKAVYSEVSASFGPITCALILTIGSDTRERMKATADVTSMIRNAVVWDDDPHALESLLRCIDRSLESVAAGMTDHREDVRQHIDDMRLKFRDIESELFDFHRDIIRGMNRLHQHVTATFTRVIVTRFTPVDLHGVPTNEILIELYGRLPRLARAIVSWDDLTLLIAFGVSFSGMSKFSSAVLFLALAFARRFASLMFKQPTVIHLIFVIDLNDYHFQMPFADAMTSEVFHNAVQDHIGSNEGRAWVAARRYVLTRSNIQSEDCGDLPTSWDSDQDTLQPGDWIRMDGLVHGAAQKCPVCGHILEHGLYDERGWTECDKCAANLKPSDHPAPQHAEDSQGDIPTGFVPQDRQSQSYTVFRRLRVFFSSLENEPAIVTRETLLQTTVFSSEDRNIASGLNEGTIRIWDAETAAELDVLRGHRSRVSSVAFLPNDKHITSASFDNTVRIWDTTGEWR